MFIYLMSPIITLTKAYSIRLRNTKNVQEDMNMSMAWNTKLHQTCKRCLMWHQFFIFTYGISSLYTMASFLPWYPNSTVNLKIWGGQYNLQLTVFTLIDGQLIHMQGNCRLRVQEIAILMYFWLGLMEIDKPSGKYFSFVRIIFHTKENIIIQILQEFNMELWKCFEKGRASQWAFIHIFFYLR